MPLGLITPGIFIVFAAGFVWAWSITRGQYYPLIISASCLLFAIGMTSQVLFWPPNIAVNALVSGNLHTLAVLVGCEGFMRRAGTTLGLKFPVAAFAVIMFLLWYFAYPSNNLIARIYTQNFGYGLVFLITSMYLIARGSKTTTDSVLAIALFVFAAHFFPRTILTIGVMAPEGRAEFGASPFWQTLQLSLSVFGAALGLTVLAASLNDALDALRLERDRDGLTGVFNRRGFDERALRLLRGNRSENTCLILCDLDYFKKINDTYGHSAGDATLAAFGALLQSDTRPVDIAGRVGGEEFAVLLHNSDITIASALANRLRTNLREAKFDFLPTDRLLTASFGIAECKPGQSYRDVFEVADARLYRAKSAGRDQVVWTD